MRFFIFYLIFWITNVFITNVKLEETNILIGSPFQIEHFGDILKNITIKGIQKWNVQNNQLEKYYKLKSINRVISQIVNGVTYELNATLVETKCVKNESAKNDLTLLENCNIENDSNTINCFIKIWYRPWLNSIDIVEPKEKQTNSLCDLSDYVKPDQKSSHLVKRLVQNTQTI
jgi:hypothetical protein